MKLLGFCCVGCLVAGSAMGQVYAPEFTGTFPSFIMTDRTPDAQSDEFDAPNGGWGGAERASSAFLFRYDDAIDLASMVDVRDAGSLENVKVVFTEYSDEMDLDPNSSGKTISINGKTAVDNFPMNPSDFDPSQAFDLSDSYLDFRNIDFSPGTGEGPFDPVGDVTGENILETETQTRVVTLHLGSDDYSERGSSSDGSFLVITTLDGADRLEYPDEPCPTCLPGWEFGGPYDSNFDVFQVVPSSFIAGYNKNGAWETTGDYNVISPNLNGFSTTPSILLTQGQPGAVPNGATEVVLESAASDNVAQTGFLSLECPSTVDLVTGTLYRVRVVLSASSPVQNADLYVQIGSTMSSGTATVGYKDESFCTSSVLEVPRLTTTPIDVDLFMIPKVDLEADLNTLRIMLVDYNSSGGMEVTVHGGSIAWVGNGLSDFGAPVNRLNLGGDVDLTANEPAPPVDPVPFATGTIVGESVNVMEGGYNQAMDSSAAVTAGGVVTVMDTDATEGMYWDYQQLEVYHDFAGGDLDLHQTGIATDPTMLYAYTVYANTDSPEATMPNLIPFVINDLTNLAGVNYHVGGPDNKFNVPSLTPNPITQLATKDKAYRVFFSPQTPNDMAKTQLGIQLSHSAESLVEGASINITRIVLDEYIPN